MRDNTVSVDRDCAAADILLASLEAGTTSNELSLGRDCAKGNFDNDDHVVSPSNESSSEVSSELHSSELLAPIWGSSTHAVDGENEKSFSGVLALDDESGAFAPRKPSIRPSFASLSPVSLDSSDIAAKVTLTLQDSANLKTRIRDDASVYSLKVIFLAVFVAICCGFAAFTLSGAVGWAGCLSGVNGCDSRVLSQKLESVGISRSLFFILAAPASGFVCSQILFSTRLFGGVARACKSGGSIHTKILVASGDSASGWICILRILLASIYLGGGNPLGTEGPIIHLSVCLATWILAKMRKRGRKLFGTFAVIGAAAGISAGFGVLVTGFVYVIEELTRTLSYKLALILAFAAALAVLVKKALLDMLENLLHVHPPHGYFVPKAVHLEGFDDSDEELCLLLALPIGVLMGIAGWIFTRVAYISLKTLRDSPRLHRYIPERLHLTIIGLVVGLLGAIGYEVTGVNAVWGTTANSIPDVLSAWLPWEQILLLFFLKLAAFISATAGGGPGGLLVPSLVCGGLLGLTVGRTMSTRVPLCSGCAIIGMGAMFASVMGMPLTGVILMFELVGSKRLLPAIIIAIFTSTNVMARLPHGEHSFVHLCLDDNPIWKHLRNVDFIETDAQEEEANVTLFQQSESLQALREVLRITDSDRMRWAFNLFVAAVGLVKLQEEGQVMLSRSLTSLTSLSSLSSMSSSSRRKRRTVVKLRRAVSRLNIAQKLFSLRINDDSSSGKTTTDSGRYLSNTTAGSASDDGIAPARVLKAGGTLATLGNLQWRFCALCCEPLRQPEDECKMRLCEVCYDKESLARGAHTLPSERILDWVPSGIPRAPVATPRTPRPSFRLPLGIPRARVTTPRTPRRSVGSDMSVSQQRNLCEHVVTPPRTPVQTSRMSDD